MKILLLGLILISNLCFGQIEKTDQERINELETRINEYAHESGDAKVIQWVGLSTIGGGLLAQALMNEKFKKDTEDYLSGKTRNVPEQKQVKPVVYGVGILTLSIGIFIDRKSSKKLTLK